MCVVYRCVQASTSDPSRDLNLAPGAWGPEVCRLLAGPHSFSSPTPPQPPLRLRVGETHSPGGTRIWQEEGPGGQSVLITATLAGIPTRTGTPDQKGRCEGCSRRLEPALSSSAAALFCPQVPLVRGVPRAYSGRRQGCRFETLRLLPPLRSTSTRKNLSVRS